MNVLVIAPQPFFRIRGTPINIRNLVSALGRAGHQVDLLCYPFGEDLDLPGTRILRSPGFPGVRDCKVGPSAAKFPLDAMMALAVAIRLLRKRYDVVHAVEESAFFAAPLARLRGIPLVYDMDSLISDQLAYSGFIRWKPLLNLVTALERRTLRRAAAVVTVCTSLTEAARRLVPDAHISQIEDAPLERAFVHDAAGAEALRRQYQLSGKKIVAYTGNFEAYQGLPLLLDALPSLLARVPDAVLLLVGGEERHRLALEEKASRAGLSHAVCFTGLLPMEKMPACLGLADVLVSPRVKGTNTALKLYGYMQTGIPIVATNLETHTQVLDDTCAWLCPADPGALGNALAEALEQPEEGRERGAAAARRVNEQFGLDRFDRQVRELYEQLAGNPAG